MPADTPDMVLVPRDTLEELLTACGKALSASPLGASGEGALAPLVPTEQAGGPVVGYRLLDRGSYVWLAVDNQQFQIGPAFADDEEGPSSRAFFKSMIHRALGKLAAAPSTTTTAEQVGMTTEGRNAPNPPGEGEAPVAWQARIKPDGEWFHVSEPYAERRRAEAGIEMRPLFTRPTPATPEGLREKVERVVERLILDAAQVGMAQGNTVASRVSAGLAAAALRDPAVKSILSALQPQAQGGE